MGGPHTIEVYGNLLSSVSVLIKRSCPSSALADGGDVASSVSADGGDVPAQCRLTVEMSQFSVG